MLVHQKNFFRTPRSCFHCIDNKNTEYQILELYKMKYYSNRTALDQKSLVMLYTCLTNIIFCTACRIKSFTDPTQLIQELISSYWPGWEPFISKIQAITFLIKYSILSLYILPSRATRLRSVKTLLNQNRCILI